MNKSDIILDKARDMDWQTAVALVNTCRRATRFTNRGRRPI